MNTIYRNTLDEDLSCSISKEKQTALGASISSAYWALRSEAEDENANVEDWEFFAENAETIKKLAQQIIEAVDGKYVKEYKLKGTK
jgi:hypothetical protein